MGIKLVVFSLFIILAVTLFPYDFAFKEMVSAFDGCFRFVKIGTPSGLRDIIANVLLFLPLGFGFTCLIRKKGMGQLAEFLVILIFSAGLSLTIEFVQISLPSRFPSSIDILTNSVGAFLGLLCFYLWGDQILSHASALVEKSKGYISIKSLMVGFMGYVILTFLISIPLQRATNLSNWDETFPLLLGNERTGDRPWRGHVSEVYIADRAISAEEVAHLFAEKGSSASIEDSLLASYQLTGKGSYPDQTGNLPDLSWRGTPPYAQDEVGGFLAPGHWLATAGPAELMTQKILETSQFTLSAVVATADTAQTGPARIISLSGDPYHRNFTLGQEGNNLVFRLRTPLTGENGVKPEWIILGVFADTNLHHLVVTYDGSVLRLYVDGLQHPYALELTSGAALFSHLVALNAYDMMGYKTLYYGLIFIPLGLLLMLIATILREQSLLQTLLICGGILLPALILESILVSVSGRGIRPGNLLLSMVITACTILLFKMLVVSSWLQSAIWENKSG